jgi:hypothetical protein
MNYENQLYKHNSRSVISMFLTFFNIFNVKNIEFTDFELCLIDFPSVFFSVKRDVMHAP